MIHLKGTAPLLSVRSEAIPVPARIIRNTGTRQTRQNGDSECPQGMPSGVRGIQENVSRVYLSRLYSCAVA